MSKQINLAAMFAAYWGATVTFNENMHFKQVPFALYKHLQAGDDCEDLGRFKLVLIPLSNISDEDGLEIIKLLDYDTSEMIADIPQWISEVMTGNCATYADYVNGTKFIKLLDFLRSRGYDCGFMDVPSLIEAGYAVQLTEKTEKANG